eukprot:jgi/Tetstr1/448723/TSEL_035960.t1
MEDAAQSEEHRHAPLRALGADGNVTPGPGQCKLPDARVYAIITGEPAQHVITAAFDPDVVDLTLELTVPPGLPLAKRIRTAGTRVATPLASWPEPVDIPNKVTSLFPAGP